MFEAAQFFYHQLTHPNPIEEQCKFALYGLYDIDLDYDRMLKSISKHSGLKDYEHFFKYISETDGDRERILARIVQASNDLSKCHF